MDVAAGEGILEDLKHCPEFLGRIFWSEEGTPVSKISVTNLVNRDIERQSSFTIRATRKFQCSLTKNMQFAQAYP